MNTSSYSLFRRRIFLPLFIVQFLEAFNDNLVKQAMILLLTFSIYLKEPSRAATMIAIAAALFILPYFILSSLSGQIADRYDKAKLIRLIKCFEIISMLIATIGFAMNNLYILFLALLLLGIHSTFFGPIKFSILPQHLKESELISGNAFIEGGTFIAILLGSILGTELPSMLHSSISTGAIFVSVIGIIIAIAGLAVSFYIPSAPAADASLVIEKNIVKSTFTIINEARKHKKIFLAILGVSWFWFVGAAFFYMIPVLITDTLMASSRVYTFFLILFSVGVAIGSLVCERIQRQYIDARYVPVGALGMSLFTILLFFLTFCYGGNRTAEPAGLAQFLSHGYNWLIVIDIALMSIFSGIFIVPLNTIIQHWSDKAYLSRIIAANNIINAIAMVAASLVMMLLNKIPFFTIPIGFMIIGVLNFFAAIYICTLVPEAVLKVSLECILKLLYKIRVEGYENYARAGDRMVIIANHTSFLDGLLLAVFLPRKAIFAINSYFVRKWWVKPLGQLVDFYPLDPMNPTATISLIKEIRKGRSCVIFPEGRLTMTGALMKVYEGPGTIAEKSEANILPVRIDGALYTPFTRARGKVFTRLFPKITIKILPHTRLEPDASLSARENRGVSSSKLYKIMTEMMFASSDREEKLFISLIKARKVFGGSHRVVEDLNRMPMSYNSVILKAFIFGGYIRRVHTAETNIGILLPNSIPTIITFFALHSCGKVPVFLNFSSGIRNILHACKTVRLKTIFTSEKFVSAAGLQPLVESLTGSGYNLVYLENLKQGISAADKFKGFACSLFPLFSGKRLSSQISSESPAVILFTSGSEGMPKGVALSHRNLQANRFQLSSKIDFNAADIVFNALPLFHSFGLTAGTILPLLSGVKVFLYPSPLHYKIVAELIYDTNSTILFGTNAFLANYAKVAHPYDFYSVRYVFSGAEKLKNETRDMWNSKFGIRIFEGYGATETSPILSTNTPMENKNGTVGKLLPGIEYRIEKIPGIEKGGRLFVKGPNIMKGYMLLENNGELLELKDGWYDTGDIVDMDRDGFITISGRAKRFAKIAGEMISLTQIESEISKIASDKLCAVISIPDEKKGEQLVLVTEDEKLEQHHITDHFKMQGISELGKPKIIIHIDSMPLLGTGKINYLEIQNIVSGQITVKPAM